MRADFSRITFDPTKNYAGVLHQQGRVWLDADWNEDVLTRIDHQRRLAADVFGLSGTPLPGTAFQVVPLDDPNNQLDFLIGGGDGPAGHFYVRGVECQSLSSHLYSQQPDLPGASPVAMVAGGTLRAIVYLEAWDRLITYLEDDSIREIALGGPDTATRLKTVAQVKVLPINDPTIHAANAFRALPQPGQGTLTTLQPINSTPGDPCRIPDPSNFTGRDNRLYRVEIHASGDVAFPSATSPLTFQAKLAQNAARASQVVVLQGALTQAQASALQQSGTAILGDLATSERVEITGVVTSGAQTQITLGTGLKSGYATALGATLTGPGVMFQAKLASAVLAAAQSLMIAGTLSKVQADAIQASGVAILSDSASSETILVSQVVTVGGQTQVLLSEGLNSAYDPARNATLTAGVAQIKWSRDNAAFAAIVSNVETDRQTLTLTSLGRDSASAFTELDLVEVSNDIADLGPGHGFLTTLSANPDPDQLTVTLAEPLPTSFDVTRPMTLRRWDGVGWASAAYSDSGTPDMNLGDGVHIQFGGSDLRAGDYWLFTARTFDGSVGPLTDAPPSGVARVVTPLAIVNWGNQSWYDLAKIQIATQLAGPTASMQPLLDRLAAVQQGGIVQGKPVTALDLSRVEALAQGVGTAPAAISSIIGWLTQNVASPNVRPFPTMIVEEDCRTVFTPLAPPAIRITDVRTVSPDLSLLNDSSVSVDAVLQGLKFVFNDAIDPNAIGDRPVCQVAVELPFPFPDSNATDWGTATIGSLALTLGSSLALDPTNRLLTWKPTAAAASLLQARLFSGASGPAQVFAHLTLKGRFIWGGTGPLRMLDGFAAGVPRATGPATGLQLPSGDSRPGGDFEMWFRLLKSASATAPQIQSFTVEQAQITGATTISGTISLVNQAAGTVTIGLKSSDPSVTFPGATITIPAGQSFGIFTVKTTAITADTSVVLTAQIVVPTSPLGIDGPHTQTITVLRPRVQSVVFFPLSVSGGLTSVAQISLTGPLPPTGISVGLTTSAGLTAPQSTLPFPNNAVTEAVTVTTSPVTAVTSVTLNVDLQVGIGHEVTSQTLTVEGGLASIVGPPQTILVGQSADCQVFLTCQSLDILVIGLTSSAPSIAALSVGTLTFVPGQTSLTASIRGVSAGTATITATQGGLPSQSVQVTVNNAKPKEKDGKDIKEKDNKDLKENLDGKAAPHEKTHLDNAPVISKGFDSAFDRPPVAVTVGGEDDPIVWIRRLSSRIDELEGRLGNARAFIRPEERPDVGRKAIDLADGDGRSA